MPTSSLHILQLFRFTPSDVWSSAEGWPGNQIRLHQHNFNCTPIIFSVGDATVGQLAFGLLHPIVSWSCSGGEKPFAALSSCRCYCGRSLPSARMIVQKPYGAIASPHAYMNGLFISGHLQRTTRLLVCLPGPAHAAMLWLLSAAQPLR